MKRSLSLALCLFVVAFATAAVAGDTSVGRDYSGYQIAVEGQGVALTSSGSAGMSKAQSDSFYIYGGPGSVVGMFQALIQDPGGACDEQGWTGQDLTVGTPIWRVIPLDDSGDINDATLGGSYAAASHHDDVDYLGYGNNWNDWLVMEIDLAAVGINPADPTAVGISLDYCHDTEPGYDYFRVQYQSSNAYTSLLDRDSSSYVDSTSTYANRTYAGVVNYAGNDYNTGGANGLIRLRIRVDSDGAWSDEDGFWSTAGRGAAAVDDIVVTLNAGAYSDADWEDQGGGCDPCVEGDISGHDNGPAAGTSGWEPTPSEFVGDFAKQFTLFEDIDPCRDNETCQWTFIDDGTPASNDPLQVPTAGSTSPTWSYGIPLGYVVNYTGGLTNETNSLNNEIWSPEFPYDLPGAADDVANGGAVLLYTRYSHMPLTNGIFAVWSVRGFTAANEWSAWDNNNFVYYSDDPAYGNFVVDVSDKLPGGVEDVQIAMGVTDLAGLFDFPGTDATPAPLFDNVRMKKYTIPGPVFSTRTIQLMSDGFPNAGGLATAIRWDSNMDRGIQGGPIVPGDSLTVDILAIIPGTTLVDPIGGVGGTMRVAMVANPDFAAARANGLTAAGAVAAGTVTDAADAKFGWQIYTMSVPGEQVINNGTPVQDRFFWDLPDGAPNVNAPHQVGVDFAGTAVFFPGDVIHYYVEATDDQPATTTIPAVTTGFMDFTDTSPYSRTWTTRGLPTLQGGTQPEILWWNDFGHRGGEDEWGAAFLQNGMYEGEHYDTYTTKGPSSNVGNGLGTPNHHGANDAQLAGYDCMIYTSGNLGSGTISDGTDTGNNGKSNDVAVLTSWHNQLAPRYHVYFGDDIVHSMVNGGLAATTYIQEIVGATAAIAVAGGNVGPIIQDQTAPIVKPVAAAGCGTFVTDYVAYGGCLVINDFDVIQPANAAVVATHEFTDTAGNPYGTRVNASLYWARNESGFPKRTMVFAHDLLFARDILNTTSGAKAARAELLREVMDCFGKPAFGAAIGNDAVAGRRMAVEQNFPNPFNPNTTIKFTAPSKGEVSLAIYNVRGELVTTMTQLVEAGANQFEWHGRDANGASVSSGVYMYTVKGFGQSETSRMVLLK